MKLVHTWDSHNYPFYIRQVDILKTDTGLELWGYHDTYVDYKNYKKLISDRRNINCIRKQMSKIMELKKWCLCHIRQVCGI